MQITIDLPAADPDLNIQYRDFQRAIAALLKDSHGYDPSVVAIVMAEQLGGALAFCHNPQEFFLNVINYAIKASFDRGDAFRLAELHPLETFNHATAPRN